MNETLKNENSIREYLLGRVSDETRLAEFEELLFLDDEFCSLAEITEDALINDFVFGGLNETDTADFNKTLESNRERREKVALTKAIKEKANLQTATEKETKPSFFDSLGSFFQKPLNVGAFAVLLIGILLLSFFVLRKPNDNELAELKKIYAKERPTETRISEFDYAPLTVTRGAAEEREKSKLRRIENNLSEAVEKNPSAKTHYALGVFYLLKQNFSEAAKEFENALKFDEKNAKIHNDLGAAYFGLSNYGEKSKKRENLMRANEEFSEALELNADLLEAIFNKSLVLHELNLPKEAKESWNLYLRKDSSSKWADEARKNLERLENQPSSFKKKEEVFREFLTAFRNNDAETVWKIHTQTKGTFSGVSLSEQLTRAFLEARKRKDQAQAQENLTALNFIGNLEREKHADFFFAELAEFYSKIEESKLDVLLKAKDLTAEGINLVRGGKYSKSIEKFEESKTVFQQTGDEFEAAVAEIWVAQMLPDVSRISESRSRLKSLIEIAEKRNFKIFLPTSYYWIGVGNYRQSELSESIFHTKKALQIAEETENIYEIQHTAESLSGTYKDLGELDKALSFIEKAVEIKDLFYANAGQIWRNKMTVAELAGQLGFASTAVDFAGESLDLSKQILADNDAVNSSLRELTKALAAKKKFKEALKFADESNALALSREKSPEADKTVAESFLWRADLKSHMKNCGAALPDYEKSLEFYGNIPEMTFNLYNVHKGKLLCFDNLQRQSDFQTELAAVLKLSENYRLNIREDESRQAFFDNEQIVFDVAVKNFLAQNDSRQAFDLVEISKARSLLDFVKSEKSIVEVEREFSAVAKPLALTEIQARLPENVQVVQYAVLQGKLAIWVLTKNRFELIEKNVSDEEFAKKIDDYRQAVIEKNDVQNLRKTAQELYGILIPPNLEKDKMICLIPDKSLHQLPFAALVSEEGKFLLEDFTIFYAPSVSVFVSASENAKRKEQVKNENLLIVGNPSFDRQENPNLADLPEAETEARKIAENYPNAQKFTAENASKESFLNNLEKAEIIHFAGHFSVNAQSSGNSKLLFADGDLRSFELAGRKIPKSKLVILSACETGFERFNRSEGAIGIARTFLAMGTPLVVAGNWKVDSEASKNLMILFHQNRREKGLTSAESLRQAQLELLRREVTAAPYFWSGFSLVGGFTNY